MAVERGAVLKLPAAADLPPRLGVHTYRVAGRRSVARPPGALVTVPFGARTLSLTGASPDFNFQAKSASLVVTLVRKGPRAKTPDGGSSRYVDPYQTRATTAISSSAVVITSAPTTRRGPSAPGRSGRGPRALTSGITCSTTIAVAPRIGPADPPKARNGNGATIVSAAQTHSTRRRGRTRSALRHAIATITPISSVGAAATSRTIESEMVDVAARATASRISSRRR